MTTIQDFFEEAWEPHSHEGENGTDGWKHLHAPHADWSLSVGLSVTMKTEEVVDPISLMEFRARLMGFSQAMEVQRQSTDLSEHTTNEQQFTIIAYNADKMLMDSLTNVVDQALIKEGIDPPCQLQEIESSNIRSFGFVLEQGADGSIPTEGRLYVAFHGGTLYAYDGVPAVIAQNMVEADSRGSYLNKWVKGEYEATKIV